MAENGQYVNNSIWFYAPNKGAPVAWATFFAISCALHTWQTIHYKSWRFSWAFPWAALIFTAGYILREIGAFHYTNLNVYIASIVLVYAAPPIYELANYIILGRILYYIPQYSPIHPGRVYTTFGMLSAVVEAISANGAARSANSSLTQSQQNLGKSLIKASLVLQLVVLVSFVSLAGTFHWRCHKAKFLPRNIKTMLYTLYVSSTLISIRTIYRTVEYWTAANIHVTKGTNPNTFSPIIRYEWFYWVFEGVMMLLNGVLQNWQHPGKHLPRSHKVFLAQDGVTEVEGPGFGEHRNFVLTLVDPFDLIGLVRGRDQRDRYWENTALRDARDASTEPQSSDKTPV